MVNRNTERSNAGDRAGKALLIESEEATREEETSLICDGKPQIDEEENVELTDVELTGDVGPLLVVRRACYSPRDTEGESWLRNNIFQSTCTRGGKICRFVIDSGSCENVIAEEAVNQVGLKTEAHPAPYHWRG